MDAAKTVLTGNFTTNAYIKITERSQINNVISYVKELEKEQMTKVKRRKIINIRAEINEIETR